MENRIILYVFSLSLIFSSDVFSQDKINSYYSTRFGFKIIYLGELKEQNSNEFVIKLSTANNDENKMQATPDYVNIFINQEPSVYLPATYGGRLFLTNRLSADILSNRYVIEEDTINGLIITKEFWLVYGGMGSWDTIINCYTKYQNKYYTISFIHQFLSGIPGEIIDGKVVTKRELIEKTIKIMKDNRNKSVKAFNNLLSSFSISK